MATEESIRKLIENSDEVDFAPFGQGASDELIEKTERRLGLKLPPSYVWWLKNYKGGEIRGQEIYSIYASPDFQRGGDIVYMQRINKENGTAGENQLFICKPPGHDESFYFLIDERLPNNELPIYLYDFASGLHTKYANDFLEFLEKLILGYSRDQAHP